LTNQEIIDAVTQEFLKQLEDTVDKSFLNDITQIINEEPIEYRKIIQLIQKI